MVLSDSVKESRKMLEQFKIFYGQIRDHIRDQEPTVKVVILDSGIDADHPFIKKEWKERSEASYRDFVEKKELPCDEDGHGTHCAGIVLQYAPGASLYVARIAKTLKSLAKDREIEGKVVNVGEFIE